MERFHAAEEDAGAEEDDDAGEQSVEVGHTRHVIRFGVLTWQWDDGIGGCGRLDEKKCDSFAVKAKHVCFMS